MLARGMHAVALLMAIACGNAEESARLARETVLPGGITVEYFAVLPSDVQSLEDTPVVVFLPPGHQRKKDARYAADRYCPERSGPSGLSVLIPVAKKQSFFDVPYFWRGSDELFPALLDSLGRDLGVRSTGVHLLDVDNGGRGAMTVFLRAPERFASITIVPVANPDWALFRSFVEGSPPRVTFVLSNHDAIPIEEHVRQMPGASDLIAVDRVEVRRMTEGGRMEVMPHVWDVIDSLSESGAGDSMMAKPE